MTAHSGWRRAGWLRTGWSEHLRWLVLPFAVGLFVLVGLAVSTEDRETFRAQRGAENDPADQELDRAASERLEPAPLEATGSAASGGTASDAAVAPANERSDQSSGQGGPGSDQSPPDRTLAGDVAIETAAGEVSIQLGGEQPVVIHQPADGRPLARFVLGGAAAGDDELLFGSDGTLDRRASRPIRDGEAAIVGDSSSVQILTAGGVRVGLRQTGPPSSPTLGLTRLDDGEGSALELGSGGLLDLGDGVVLRLPGGAIDSVAFDDAIGDGRGDAGAGSSLWEEATAPPWRWLIVGGFAVAAVALLFRLRPRSRSGQPSGAPAETAAPPISLARFDELVALLAEDDDPARAIRLAFHVAERGLGALRPRRTTETPFEWYQRVADIHPQLADPLGSLCNRFATARFAPQRPTLADRDATIAELVALRRLATELGPIGTVLSDPGPSGIGPSGTGAGPGVTARRSGVP